MWERARIDAGAIVSDDEHELLFALLLLQFQRDVPSSGSELHRVPKQVGEHLHDAIVIERGHHGLRRQADG